MNGHSSCSLAEGFSFWEKSYAQFSFFAMSITGTVSIAIADWPWVLPYLIINWYAVPGIVMRHLVCPRCPHLHQYNDCLQFPPKATRWLVRKQKVMPMNGFEKFLFVLIFTLIPIYPIYWLLSNKVLLIIFLASAAMWYAGQFLRFCKRCRVSSCPFNRVTT